MANRSKCAPACPGCTRRYRRAVLTSSAFSALAILLEVLSLFTLPVLAFVGVMPLVAAGRFGWRAIKLRDEVRAAEATARRYGGRR